ncbi:hypothetical protein [Gryllotalpicola kribbensis]
MGTTTAGETYTAKLLDGPLEGRTIATSFLDGGTPQGRLVLPANDRGKKYVYRRSGEISEFADGTGAPGAVDYRYFGAEFD